MCDYSLAGLPNRLAVEGEQLVVYRFTTGAMGLAPSSPGFKQLLFPSRTPAVCIPPGRDYACTIYPYTCNNAAGWLRSRTCPLFRKAPKHSHIGTPYGLPMARKFCCNTCDTASVWMC